MPRQELARKGIDRALAERTLKSFFGNTRRLAVVPLAPTGYGDEEGQEADEEGGGSSSIMGAEELGYGSTGGGVGLFSRDARPLIPLDRGHAGKGTGDQVAEEDGEQGSQSAGSLHHGSQGGGAGGAAAAAGRQEEEEDLNFPDPESASSERGGQLLAVAARRLQSLRQQPEEVQRWVGWVGCVGGQGSAGAPSHIVGLRCWGGCTAATSRCCGGVRGPWGPADQLN